MNSSMLKVLITIFLFSAVALAQQPTVNCSEADLRASMAERRAAAERLRAETCGAVLDSLRREVDKQKTQLGETERRLISVQGNAAELESKVVERDKMVVDKDQKILILTRQAIANRNEISKLVLERDGLLLKIRRANGRFICEVFRVGCIR